MPEKRLRKHLPHSAADLMRFVADVERYPEFINIISALRVLGGRKVLGDVEEFEAEMRVTYKFLSERVRCTVIQDNAAQTIIVRKAGQDGALKRLTNDWKFHTLSDGSTYLDFFVDVTLKAAPLNFLAAQKFDVVSEKIMDVFVARAAQVCPKVGTGEDMSNEISVLSAGVA